MPNYHYRALDRKLQSVEGGILAETAAQAIADLESRGLTVQSIALLSPETKYEGITDEASSPPSDANPPLSAASTDEELGRIALQSLMAKAMEQGQAITSVLRAYEHEMPTRGRRRQVQQVIRTLECGDTAQAVSQFCEQAEYWLPLFGTMAASSTPGAILDGFVTRVGKISELRRQWWLILAYPLTVACLAGAALAIISIFVAPTFRAIYLSFDLQLPASTKLLLTICDWIQSGWAILLVAIAIGILVSVWVPVNPRFGHALSSWFLSRLPNALTPRRAKASLIGRFAMYVADLLDAGLTIPNALRVAGLAVERRTTRQAANGLAREMELQSAVSRFGTYGVLSVTLVHAVRSELSLPSRIRLIRQISQCHLERADNRAANFDSAVGPLAIVTVGLIVGWTVLALFFPLIRLIQLLS